MAASGASSHTLLITCITGLISSASSMTAGEYISVKSQVDIEKADLDMESRELQRNPVKGNVGPVSMSVMIGAFIFGIGMQLGGGSARMM